MTSAPDALVNILEDLQGDDLQLSEGIDTALINIKSANFALSEAHRQRADNLTFLVYSADLLESTLIAPPAEALDP